MEGHRILSERIGGTKEIFGQAKQSGTVRRAARFTSVATGPERGIDIDLPI